MERFMKIEPRCRTCSGEFIVNEIMIDFPNCLFILFLECIVCGEEKFQILSLEDFIDISKLTQGDVE